VGVSGPTPGSPGSVRVVIDARTTARLYRDVAVPMRDGTVLRADVWAPDRGGRRVPVLLERLPYDKSISLLTTVEAGLEPARALDAGYAVVVQDTRGRFASEGSFDPYVHEALDGVDTIAWCAGLPFSDGRVGMVGASYFGATQLLAAAAAPPALRAIAPTVTGSDFYEGWTYYGGSFQLGFALCWTLLTLAPNVISRVPDSRRRSEYASLLADAVDDIDATYRRLPLTDLGGLEEVLPFYLDWLRHDTRDLYWQSRSALEGYTSIRTPALHIGGWYDLFVSGTIENYRTLRRCAATDEARLGQRLVVGPWAHGNFGDTIGDLQFGSGAAKAALDTTELQLAFFDQHLRGYPVDDVDVRVFLMGADTWLHESDWPPVSCRRETWFLHSGGRANSSQGDGILSLARCAADESPDDYVYDPAEPVPTVGGATFLPGAAVSFNAGPRDQSAVERRDDVLVYTSAPLVQDMDVVGSVRVTLHVQSSAPDTDFTAKLVDVHPDGRAYLVCDGIVSLRYARSGGARGGDVDAIHVDLGPTAMRFKRRHRIRLEVSSSNFPRFARNPNSGGRAGEASAADFRTARQRLFHDAGRPSSLDLIVRP
jgi:uncharacterized protein